VLVKAGTVVQWHLKASVCFGDGVRDPGGRQWIERFAERGRILYSTRIARTLAPSSHAGSEESSLSGRSAACIIGTNSSPPDSLLAAADRWSPLRLFAIS
jgi:hypothetical protein